MWKDLSMKEKAAFMKVAIKNGITDLGSIRDKYNSYAEGGPVKNYSNWSERLANTWGITTEELEKHDYDYRKYYDNNTEDAWRQLEDVRQGVHFPDGGKGGTYKKLNHPTYPDRGEKSWSPDDRVFYPSSRQMEDSDIILDTLGHDKDYFNGGAKVSYEGEVLPTVYVYPDSRMNETHLKRNKANTGWIYRDRNEFAGGGLLDNIRKRLYRNITPVNYKDPIKRAANAIIFNNPDEFKGNKVGQDRDDIWAEYLNIPKYNRRNISKYKVIDSSNYPTKGSRKANYKTVSNFEDMENALVRNATGITSNYPFFDESTRLNIGQNVNTHVLGNLFGNHTIGRGYDNKKGEYISYYDKWDLAPFTKFGMDQSFGVGNPIEFYDRVYLDDYYKVPRVKLNKGEYDAGYLPEVTIVGTKKQ